MRNTCTYLLLALGLLASWWPAAAQNTSAFAKGADISWVTELEANNYKFINKAGAQQDLFQLLQGDYGLNTIRLRVWVNPPGGYNGAADVLAKALRAKALGYRLLIDFHYSDTFADPAHQTKPAAWQNYTVAQLKQAVYDHTTSVLTLLKTSGITPEWVQVGNETNDGMLWPEGRLTVNGFANFAAFVDQGYAAVKAMNASTKVIAHFANGQDNGAFRYYFDGLQANGARWDVAGLSLYPDAATWPTYTAQAQANMNDMVSRYPGKQVMVVEVGMPAYVPLATREFLYDIIAKTQAVSGNNGLGVLYWEPEAYNWQGYTLGAWGTDGRATAALDGFLSRPTPQPLIANAGFEYTAATQNPPGWTTFASVDTDADYTETGGHNSQFRLTHYKATAYQVLTNQDLSNVPNGTYTLRAWVRNGGGQTTCQLYAQPRGGTALTLALPTAADWTQINLPGIVVSNGQLEIGLRSIANAGNYCSLDDVELVLSSTLATTPAASAALGPQLYPNPASGPLSLRYELPAAGPVQVALYATTGQLVQTLAALPTQAAGPHELALTPTALLSAGAYVLVLRSGAQQWHLQLMQP